MSIVLCQFFICNRDFLNISGKFSSFLVPALALNCYLNSIFLLILKVVKCRLLNGHERYPAPSSQVSVFYEGCPQISREETCPRQRTYTHRSAVKHPGKVLLSETPILAWKWQFPNIPDWTQSYLMKELTWEQFNTRLAEHFPAPSRR